MCDKLKRKRVGEIKLTPRQEEIIRLVKENPPITSERLANKLGVTRAALRPDLAILTMTGILEARPKVGYIYSKKPSYSLVYDYIRNIKVNIKNVLLIFFFIIFPLKCFI